MTEIDRMGESLCVFSHQMRAEDIREFTRKQPFDPFRIHITGGHRYDIFHPNQVFVSRSRLIVGGIVGNDGIPETIEHIALIHIVKIEELNLDRDRAN